MADVWYYLSEHLESIQWIEQLPSGLVSERINLSHNTVLVENKEGVHTVYIGPKDPDQGGDGIFITLDRKFNLIDYVIERIEPLPTGDE